jgi:NAD dependent epimerase/dehydratase family enzyme
VFAFDYPRRVGAFTKRSVLSRLELPSGFSSAGLWGMAARCIRGIHLTDLVEGILFLLEKPEASGVYNFTAPNPVRNLNSRKYWGK